MDDSFDIDDDDNEIEKNKEDGIEEALEDLYPGLCNKNAPEGMTLDDGIEQLEKIIERSEEILRERECTCELTEISKEYIRLACWLSGYTHLVNKLYSLNKKMLDMIADHPRLKLKLLHIQLDVLHDIEVQSNAPYGLSITQDVEYEISTYENCIALADKVNWTRYHKAVRSRKTQWNGHTSGNASLTMPTARLLPISRVCQRVWDGATDSGMSAPLHCANVDSNGSCPHS